MTKHVLRLTVLASFTVVVSAESLAAQAEHRLFVQLGLNSATQRYSSTSNTSSVVPTHEANTRFVVGLGYGIKSGRFGFSAELNYSSFGATQVEKGSISSGGVTQTFDIATKPTFDYLEVPIQVGYYAVDAPKFRVKLMAGPWIGFALGGKVSTNGTVTTDFSGLGTSTEAFSETLKIKVNGEYNPLEPRMNPFQFGALGGIGLEFAVSEKINLGVEPRYLIGLSNIRPNSDSGTGAPDDQSTYHRAFSVLVRASIRL